MSGPTPERSLDLTLMMLHDVFHGQSEKAFGDMIEMDQNQIYDIVSGMMVIVKYCCFRLANANSISQGAAFDSLTEELLKLEFKGLND